MKPKRTSRPTSGETPLPNREANVSTPTLPVSGSEQPFTDLVYGTPRGKGNNNCYAWAIDDYRNGGNRKLQPGNLSGKAGQNMDLGSCQAITSRAMADLKDRGYAASADTPCKRGFYKVMAFLAPGNDYHWYKQHKDAVVRLSAEVPTIAALAKAMGVRPADVYSPSSSPGPGDVVLVKNAKVWSHKQGHATGPLLRDACGRSIRDPRKACRTYSPDLDYTTYCGSMCVKAKSR